jgi:hypothetical protein
LKKVQELLVENLSLPWQTTSVFPFDLNVVPLELAAINQLFFLIKKLIPISPSFKEFLKKSLNLLLVPFVLQGTHSDSIYAVDGKQGGELAM